MTDDQRRRFQSVETIQRLLRNSRTIAIVGLSTHPEKASHFVGTYLQHEGYRIVPVNPHAREILGEQAYPALASIPFSVDLVDVFRPGPECLGIAEQAIAARIPAIWFQLRIDAIEGAERASAAGLDVVVDRCTKMEHGRWGGTLHWAGMNTELVTARKRRRSPSRLEVP